MARRDAPKAIVEVEKPSKGVQNTSISVAYRRGLSDIPNAKRVLALMLANNPENNSPVSIKDNLNAVVVYLEARYKAIDALLRQSGTSRLRQGGVSQVVEFAAGFSPRGMNNPQWNYVHTDQDESSLDLMKAITRTILSERSQVMPNFVKFDAITGEGNDSVMACLRDEPVGIVHEGLFRYYPHSSKEKTVGLAVAFLERYGGIYVTPDIHTPKQFGLFEKMGVDIAERQRRRSKETGRDLASFIFKDNAEWIEMAARLGLVATPYKVSSLVDRLSTIPVVFKDKATQKLVEQTVKEFELWKMTLRK